MEFFTFTTNTHQTRGHGFKLLRIFLEQITFLQEESLTIGMTYLRK